jgi:GT2 family glycosyltransferase
VGTHVHDVATMALLARLEPTTEVPIVTAAESVDAMMSRQNAAIRRASGDIIAFIDDDAVARPGWLARLATHYSDEMIGAAGGRDVIWIDGAEFDGPARRVGAVTWYGRLYGNHHMDCPGIREAAFLKGCNMSFRRELLKELDPRLHGSIAYGYEIDLCLHVRRRGYRVIYDPEALVDHFPSTDMGAHIASLAEVTNHNHTYVLLKNLSLPRKVSFVAYTGFVGDKSTIGMARVPWLMLRRGWSLRTVAAHARGKIGGIRTYLGSIGRPKSPSN